jgi:membrane-associated protein
MLTQVLDAFLHLDNMLPVLLKQYGGWIYLLLGAIVFCESAFIFTPMLPGDALLFSVGSLCALDALSLSLSALILGACAILGYQVNYLLGRSTLHWLQSAQVRMLHHPSFVQTRDYLQRFGAKALVFARFIPMVRTFAPFLAGLSELSLTEVMLFNVVGAVVWIAVGLLAGYCFGQIHFVQTHFTGILLAIILVSLLPVMFQILRARVQQAVKS